MLGRIRGKPKDDDEALELLRQRTAARLAAIVGISADAPPEDDLGPDGVMSDEAVSAERSATDDELDESALSEDEEADAAAVAREAALDAADDDAADDDAADDAAAGDASAPTAADEHVAPRSPAATVTAVDPAVSIEPGGEALLEGAELEDEPLAARDARERAALPVTLSERAVPVMAAEAAAADRPPSRTPIPVMRPASVPGTVPVPKRAPPAKPKARRRKGDTLLPAACPSCGVLLDEIPTAGRRCAACRRRIAVRRIDGRTVLIADTVAPFFDSHRRALLSGERIKREAGRWLQMAALAGALPEVLEARARAVAAKPRPEAVGAARALYATTVERAVRAARKGRDWKAVADLRFRQARAYHRASGSAVPVDAAIAALHREAVEASLRRLREAATDAVLVGGTCCEACRAETGRVVRIAAERREPTVPHAACPAGLCGCRWDTPVIARRSARPRRRETTAAGAGR